MGHYRADMYATEEEWKNRHKFYPSTTDQKYRDWLLEAVLEAHKENEERRKRDSISEK